MPLWPAHRFILLIVYGLAFVAANGLATDTARALERFDFEPPYLLDPGHSIKDHSLIRVGTTWHCFYIRGDGSPGTASENAIGHAVSEDLRNWSVLSPAITAGPGAWEARNVWAPQVIPSPANPSTWTMLYTGASTATNQRMGLAVSFNSSLALWSKSGANPLLWPQDPSYDWSEEETFSAFRDPFFFQMDGLYHVLNTAGIIDTTITAGRRGVVHHATSNDLVNWNELQPLAVHNGPGNLAWHDIESVQLVQEQGRWHLFFTETNVQGIRHLQSTQMDSGWDFTQSVTIDTGTAAELTKVTSDTYLFSRHAASLDGAGNVYWTIRVDSLRFDPTTHDPVIVKTDVLADDWPVRSGTGFLAAPTFGDNSLERGDTPIQPVGNGSLSTTEFFSGPLSGLGAPGIQLGGGATGTLKSRIFTVTGDLLRLNVGGGTDPGCFVALVDASTDAVLISTSGPGSPTLEEVLWDLTPYQGTPVYLWIEDASTASDGYINVDQIEEILDPTSTPPSAQGKDLASLRPSRPNPFNPRTTLRWTQRRAGWTQLSVFDAQGRRVRDFGSRWFEAGDHEQIWNGLDDRDVAVASGVYRVQLSWNGHPVDRRPVTLVR